MTNVTESRRTVLTIISDLLLVVATVVAIVWAMALVAGLWLPRAGVVVAAAITSVLLLASLPSLLLLAVAPPPRPLAQRSTLVAHGLWFWRAATGAALFLLSVAIGAVAGVAAAQAAEAGDIRSSIARAWSIVAISAAPVLGFLFGGLFLVMGVRWMIDLSRLIHSGRAAEEIANVERRWFGSQSDALPARTIRSAVLGVGIDVGRAAVPALMIVIIVNFGAAIANGGQQLK